MRALSPVMSDVAAQAIMQELANDYDKLADRAARVEGLAISQSRAAKIYRMIHSNSLRNLCVDDRRERRDSHDNVPASASKSNRAARALKRQTTESRVALRTDGLRTVLMCLKARPAGLVERRPPAAIRVVSHAQSIQKREPEKAGDREHPF
jgi:hypothetical protein